LLQQTQKLIKNQQFKIITKKITFFDQWVLCICLTSSHLCRTAGIYGDVLVFDPSNLSWTNATSTLGSSLPGGAFTPPARAQFGFAAGEDGALYAHGGFERPGEVDGDSNAERSLCKRQS
jgi:hypothetical protein